MNIPLRKIQYATEKALLHKTPNLFIDSQDLEGILSLMVVSSPKSEWDLEPYELDLEGG